jgi:hypothetical protein
MQGQSNMEMTVSLALNASAEAADAAHYPSIRLLSVQRDESKVPLDELANLTLSWSRASPEVHRML